MLTNLPFTPIAAAVVSLLVALLYGPFIESPVIFDDVYFFVNPQAYVEGLLSAGLTDRRWVSDATLVLTYRSWGLEVSAYRVGNLLMHALTAFSLFVFVRDVLARERGQDANVPALGAAMLFAVHPVAAFAAGYIIERSIVLAGLFSIWMWIAVHRGVSDDRKSWLLLSVMFYFLAVFSKEHAVTALPVAVLVAWNASAGNMRKTFSALALPLPFWIGVAITVILNAKHVIGSAGESIVVEMLQGAEDPHSLDFFGRNALNQAALFFRYALFWLLPKETWMSIDMRPPFPPTVYAWPWVLGLLAFLTYPLAIVAALRLGRLPRLAAIALLSPWLLFLPMFSAVQYQEPFVLYRSYLWAIPATLLAAFVLARMRLRAQVATMLLVGLLCFGSTWSRLQTFSHPVLLWDEAVSRLDGRDDLPGAYRIYHNRGIAYAAFGDLDRALADFNKVIVLNPTYQHAYKDRGAAYLNLGDYRQALSNFDQALVLDPEYSRAYLGRGLTWLRMGHRAEGLANLAQACRRGFACKTYEEEAANGQENR